VKSGAWLQAPQYDAHSATDPLQAFQTWRRRNFVSVPVRPEVWLAHLDWVKLHASAGARPQKVTPPRQETPAPRSLAAVSNAGNVVPAGGLSNYQGEVAVAVDSTNPQRMLAATNTFLADPNCGGNSTQDLFASQDGGKTWNYTCAPLPPALAGSTAEIYGSDPSVAWDANGNAYASYMLIKPDVYHGAPAMDSMIVLAKSTDGGFTWNANPIVNHFGQPQYFDDKPMMTVDRSSGANSHTNRIYAIWDTNNTETVSWSDDGTHWNPVVLETDAQAGMDIGGDVAVGPAGTVYAIWTRIAGIPGGPQGGDTVVFTKSSDGGQTWALPATIAAGGLSLNSFNTLIPAQDQRGINTFASIAVDDSGSPYSGSIYVVYADYPTGKTAGPAINVYMVKSGDSGGTWSPPLQVNDDAEDGASHFFPWCAVDPGNGLVHVSWYDTRNDPGYQIRTQIYYAQSSDGGASFSPNVPVSQVSAQLANPSIDYNDENSLENQYYNPNQYGDYAMLSAAGGTVLVGWTDSRQFYPQNFGDPLDEDLVTSVLQVSAPLSYTIGGQVADQAGNGIAGLQVSAGGISATTAGDGRYTLAGLANGSYTVAPASSNFTFAPNAMPVTVSGAPVAGVNFLAMAPATAPVASLSGSVTLNGQGLAGVIINDGNASATTDGQGNYSFHGLAPGNYTLTAADAAYDVEPGSRTVQLSGSGLSGIDFSVPTYSISGTIEESWPWGSSTCCTILGGLPGVTLQAGGQTTTSDANGRYRLSGLPAGYYFVASSMPGYLVQMYIDDELISEAEPWVNVSDADVGDMDFSGMPWGVYELSGSVTQNGAGLSGVKISSADTVAYTDAGGNFKIFESKAGSYALTASAPGFSFQPANQVVTIPPASAVGQVFPAGGFSATATQPVFSLSGQVTTGAGALAGVTIAAGLSSAVSGKDGNYSISGFAPQTVNLNAAAAGYSFAPDPLPITVVGADLGSLNFSGSAQQVEISGTVTTPSGPLAGAKMTMYGNGTIGQYQTTTDSLGQYQFLITPAVNADGYIVQLAQPGYLTQPSWGVVAYTALKATGVNFTALPARTVSGRITDGSGNGVSGIFVDNFPFYNNPAAPWFTTDAKGNYSFTLPAGVYTITPHFPAVPPAMDDAFSPASKRVDLRSVDASGTNFEVTTAIISGQVLRGAAGVPGVTATLVSDPASAPGGSVVATATSDAHGNFYFTNVAYGDYLIEPSLDGSGFAPAAIYRQVQGNVREVTFEAVPGAAVSGRIVDSNARGIAGVDVNFNSGQTSTGSAITDGNGDFTLNLPNGSYGVVPFGGGYVFSPGSINVTVQGQPVPGVNFVAAAPFITLTLGQTQYALNGGVDTMQDPLTISSNSTSPLSLSCNAPVSCSVTPGAFYPPIGTASANVSLSGLAGNSQSTITAVVHTYGGSPQATATITIQRQSVSLTASSTAATVTAGQTAVYALSLAPANGFQGSTALTCAAQLGYACTVSPSAVNFSILSGAQPVQVMVTIPATAQLPSWPWLALLGFGLLSAGIRVRRRGMPPLRAVCLALMLLAASACGGSAGTVVTPPPPPPPPASSSGTVTVKATSGSLVQTLTLNLTVNSGA